MISVLSRLTENNSETLIILKDTSKVVKLQSFRKTNTYMQSIKLI